MIKIGHHYNLTVTRSSGFGFFLDGENYGEILLPKRHAPKHLSKGDKLEVFLYLDSDDRPIATTQKPLAEVGQFAYLKAVDNNTVGAFFDWGLDKDLMVPFGEQHRPIEVGNFYLLFLYIDKVDSRITASSKIDRYLDYDETHSFKAGDPVQLIIANSTKLGFKAIINHQHWGMLYNNETHQRLSFGQSINGFIKQVREDRRIDLSLTQGSQHTDTARNQEEKKIVAYLEEHQGKCPLNDKSDPKAIAEIFGMSKSAFKKAIGRLYKQRQIVIHKQGICLASSSTSRSKLA